MLKQRAISARFSLGNWHRVPVFPGVSPTSVSSVNVYTTRDAKISGNYIRDAAGKVVVNTAASASRTADGDAGSMCDKAGAYVGESFTKATKEVLERLLERISNSKL